MPLNRDQISQATARRIAIAAQGFRDPTPGALCGHAHIRGAVGRLGLLQIDSVSVLARAHYLPLFARLGGYDRALLDEAAWGRRRALFEYWAHEASLLPLAMHPLFRWRMREAEAGQNIYGELAIFARERRPYVDAVFRRVVAEGPLAASAFPERRDGAGWWRWSDAKRALEWLFWAGHVTTARRQGFERVYDLPERVLPATILAIATPSRAEAHRSLVAFAASALGVATAGDLRDYFRLNAKDTEAAIPGLVEDGTLLPVMVEGWNRPAYVHAKARWPRRVEARALVGPFDPLVWDRARVERLFGFRYRIEIYTVAAKRVHGYYVLPFLLGDRLVARVDLKADRAAGVLRVLAAHVEDDAPGETAERLLGALDKMAAWLGLNEVAIGERGAFAAALLERDRFW